MFFYSGIHGGKVEEFINLNYNSMIVKKYVLKLTNLSIYAR